VTSSPILLGSAGGRGGTLPSPNDGERTSSSAGAVAPAVEQLLDLRKAKANRAAFATPEPEARQITAFEAFEYQALRDTEHLGHIVDLQQPLDVLREAPARLWGISPLEQRREAGESRGRGKLRSSS
jgi:hypothetical protein